MRLGLCLTEFMPDVLGNKALTHLNRFTWRIIFLQVIKIAWFYKFLLLGSGFYCVSVSLVISL